jgi:hypothetical protein
LDKKIITKIEYELEQIVKLIAQAQPLFDKCRKSKPDFIELSAFASVMHSFYNGIESIFLLVAKNIDERVPDDKRWHKTLLEQMTNATSGRPNVIGSETCELLIDYLEFRHFFRHAYAFKLEWGKMSVLSDNLEKCWESFQADIKKFIKTKNS